LTPEQALDRVVEYYRAWGANQPGGRRWPQTAKPGALLPQ